MTGRPTPLPRSNAGHRGLAVLVVLITASLAAMDGRTAEHVEVAAFYFPNWGPAAHSEWTAVQAAPPRFAGHAQPKVPAWGYENETDPAVMARKIAAAADHGIDAFIFDWYYFDADPARASRSPHYSADGSRYLHAALEEGYLAAANNDRLRFAVMWCNHDVWPDAKGVVGPETFAALNDHVIERYFKHPSYWRIAGRPYFSIYQVDTFIASFGGDRGRAAEALSRFRAKVAAAGFPGLHVAASLHGLGGRESRGVAEALGLDSVTTYTWIHHYPLPGFPTTGYATAAAGYFHAVTAGGGWNGLEQPAAALRLPYHVNVSMGWDSSPRCPADADWGAKRGYPFGPVIVDNTPRRFRDALERAQALALARPPAERVVTINAWNEWGEGSYLEPDTVHGMGYLEAVREVFGRNAAREAPPVAAPGNSRR